MGRPRRLAESHTHHVMARGNDRRTIFEDDADRRLFLRLLAGVVLHRRWTGFGYCLMSNHVHLVVRSPHADLPDGMRDALSRYARRFNRRHGKTGHLFAERYRSVPIDDDPHLLATLRYVALNPVRAGLVADAAAWEWSSYSETLARRPGSGCVATADVLALFDRDEHRARGLFSDLVNDGRPDGGTATDLALILTSLGPVEGVRAAVRLGHTHREIAEALGVGRTAITKRLVQERHRAPDVVAVRISTPHRGPRRSLSH